MEKDSLFFKQADLMLRMIPFVAKETCFALKGGTAINFFLRDLPRLSVDIDLTYLPLEPREQSLQKISQALARISQSILQSHPSFRIQESKVSDQNRIAKLFVTNGEVQITIEPNEVIRGTIWQPNIRSISPNVEEMFELSTEIQVVSFADLYGGKLCAAMDRQHPRDIFDVRLLLENEGITPDIRKAFVLYLAGHDRPIHEVLNPSKKDISQAYSREFQGMSRTPISLLELLETRDTYMAELKKSLSQKERLFLLSLKELQPKWDLLDIEGIDRLPAIQWKLVNLKKMNLEKRMAYKAKLQNCLEL